MYEIIQQRENKIAKGGEIGEADIQERQRMEGMQNLES